METKLGPPKLKRERMKRCADWLVSQGAHPEHLISAQPPESPDAQVESVASAHSLPVAVDEDCYKPRKVPRRKLRTDGLRLECEWRGCYYVTGDYEAYQKHVRAHIPQLHVVAEPTPKYTCLWDICGHGSSDSREMVRHVNFHAYHSKLMAVGVSAQHNLGMNPCRRDSAGRNVLPAQKEDYRCMWGDCKDSFTAIQEFFSHMKEHLLYCDGVCQWGGCGAPAGRELRVHVRSHTREKLIACGHCGRCYVNNVLLRDHLQAQNLGPDGGYKCGVCGRVKATPRLLRMHERQHVCDYACSYCDMTTTTVSALSLHIRYRHVPEHPAHRPFKCDQCDLALKTRNDLNKHRRRHLNAKTKKEKIKEETLSEGVNSEGVNSDEENFLSGKQTKEPKKYICHMCPDGENKIYSRGARLSVHLMKDHCVQWPDGHCRFRYQKKDDGFYRLTTTRYESLEVSRQIMRGVAQEPITEDLCIRVKKKAAATRYQPTLYAVDFNSQESDSDEEEVETKEVETKDEVEAKEEVKEESVEKERAPIEVTMCDVDEMGNIINSEVMGSDRIVISELLKK